MKQAKPISLKLSRERLAKEYAKKSTLEICKEYDPETKRTKNGWLEAIGLRYQPFIEKLYHDPSLLNDARHLNLCKYWALNNVTTFEEARGTIPLCKYCYVNRVLPRVDKPDITGSCHHIECQKAFKYEAIEKGIEKKYGVKNINEIEEIRKLKSEKLKKINRVNKDQIIAKRKKTCNERYDVENVSQSKEIKDRKSKTFVKNYGVDNIFKRSDLMKIFWMDALGSDNPKHVSDINIRRVRKTIKGQIENRGYVNIIKGKEFGFLHEFEEEVVSYFLPIIDVKDIKTNETIKEKIIDNKSRCVCIDVTLEDKIYIEAKSSYYYFNEKDDIDHTLKVLNLKEDELYCVVMKIEEELTYTYVDHEGLRTSVYPEYLKWMVIDIFPNSDRYIKSDNIKDDLINDLILKRISI
jgi:hypothetical protein